MTMPIGKPTSRVDSFEVIEAECISFLTDEQKNWPVGSPCIRVDGFEVIKGQATVDASHSTVALRVTVASGATTDDLAAVIQKLRAAVEDARTATGGRVVIHVDSAGDIPSA